MNHFFHSFVSFFFTDHFPLCRSRNNSGFRNTLLSECRARFVRCQSVRAAMQISRTPKKFNLKKNPSSNLFSKSHLVGLVASAALTRSQNVYQPKSRDRQCHAEQLRTLILCFYVKKLNDAFDSLLFLAAIVAAVSFIKPSHWMCFYKFSFYD